MKRGWTLDGVARPWPAGSSIHDHLKAHTKDGVLDERGFVLPGVEPAVGDLQWAAGARDGILAHHLAGGAGDDERDAMVRVLVDLFREPTAAHLAAVYTQSTSVQLAGYVDALVDALNETPGMDALRVHELGKVLATEAPDPETVKLGISLLGMVENDDRAILLQLALHDEFTMFAALALVKQIDAFEPILFELAKKVHGWGRIHVVERLAETTSKPIKAWMLRQGFRNTVMDEYLAHTCATTGELHRAFSKPDPALLSGAAGIFRALAAGGPALELSDYEHAAKAISAWLPHVTPTLEELAALDALAEREEVSPDARTRIEQLRNGAKARAAIDAGLQSTDPQRFGLADLAASERGIPTFDLHEARIAAKTDVTYSVMRLLQEARRDTIDRALAAAASVVELDQAEQRLVLVLQELPRFAAGTGDRFVLSGLRSAWPQARALAARVLGAWGKAALSDDLREALEEAAEHEDDAETKAGMERVLAGETYDRQNTILH